MMYFPNIFFVTVFDYSRFSFHYAPGKSNICPYETQDNNRTVQDKNGGDHSDDNAKAKGKISEGGTL